MMGAEDQPQAGEDRASAPALACVVMSLDNEPTLREAVASVIAQEPAMEVVVVNSGREGAAAALEGLGVRVLEAGERLLPGGARNRGVEATTAPFVSFLAADCLAEPGWSAGRLRRHEAGAPAVASALVNARSDSRAANASYLLLFHRRMPGASARSRKLYGVSYSRALLDRFGPFRDDLRTGEDTVLHARLADLVPIAWAPDVRTAHRHPAGVGALIRDQHARGVRMARGARAGGWSPGELRIAVSALRNAASATWSAWRHTPPPERRRLLRCWPLLPVGAIAYAVGAMRA